MDNTKKQIDVHWTVYALLAASILIYVGVHWDISWHRTIGRDSFWTPAHLTIQGAGILAGVSCAWAGLITTSPSRSLSGLQGVRIFGLTGPLGGWIAVWGTLAMLTSAPLDDWWHGAYGLDVTILSPPHILLALGIVAIQVGACFVALSWQNRARPSARRFLSMLYTVAAGLLIGTVAIVFMERTQFNQQHDAQFYRILGVYYPVILFAVARSGSLRFAATAAAAAYMGFALVIMWILPLFPGEPLLAPILREVTYFVPPDFPHLLIFPAIAIDLIEQRFSGETSRLRDWKVAAFGGVAFLAIVLAVQWPFAEFMLSDGSRNYFFLGHHHNYSRPPGPWETQFWHGAGGFSASAFWGRMVFVAVLAFVSARVGLWAGNWMKRLRR